MSLCASREIQTPLRLHLSVRCFAVQPLLRSLVVEQKRTLVPSPDDALHCMQRSIMHMPQRHRCIARASLPEAHTRGCRRREAWTARAAFGSLGQSQALAKLKRQLGETVNRIDTIQQGRQLSLAGKISKHFKTQSGSLINIVLTASLMAVSLGKLQQKQQHQASSGCLKSLVGPSCCLHQSHSV